MTWYDMTWHSMSCHVMSYDMSCHVIWHVMLCQVMSYVMSCHVIWHVMLCQVMSYVMSCHMSYYILKIPCHSPTIFWFPGFSGFLVFKSFSTWPLLLGSYYDMLMKLSKCQNYITTFFYKNYLYNYWNRNL